MCLIVCVSFRVCVIAYVFLHECGLVGGCSSVSVCSRFFVCMRVFFPS